LVAAIRRTVAAAVDVARLEARRPACGEARVNSERVAYACRLPRGHQGDHHPNPCGHDGCTGLECLAAPERSETPAPAAPEGRETETRVGLRARLARALSSLASMREWHRTYHGDDPCALCIDADGALEREGVPPAPETPAPEGADAGRAKFVRWAQEGPLRKGAEYVPAPLDRAAPQTPAPTGTPSFKVNVARCAEIRATTGCAGVACPECPAAAAPPEFETVTTAPAKEVRDE
jgi:hypothetical protein